MRKAKNVRELIKIYTFTRNGLLTSDGEIVFFIIRPTNISVLSTEGIEAKCMALRSLLLAIPNLNLHCLNSSDNICDTPVFLSSRLHEEKNAKIKKLLGMDIEHFNTNLRADFLASRTFYLSLVLKNCSEDALPVINSVCKQINDQGFDCKRTSISDLKMTNISDTTQMTALSTPNSFYEKFVSELTLCALEPNQNISTVIRIYQTIHFSVLVLKA